MTYSDKQVILKAVEKLVDELRLNGESVVIKIGRSGAVEIIDNAFIS